MANISLYDGTRDSRYGKVFGDALRQLALHIRRIRCTPLPGSTDIPGYNFVKALEGKAFDPRRNQVNTDIMLRELHLIPQIRNDPSEKVILSEKDFFASDGEGGFLNWVFGGYTNYFGRHYVLISTARITHPIYFQDLIAHELGHMYGAAPAGRTNTEENLGSHCTNDLCVMQQHLTVQSSQEYAIQRYEAGAPLFCRQCANDLIRRGQGM